MTIKGSLSVSNIIGTVNSARGVSNCFTILNEEGEGWELCAENSDEKQAWVCGVSASIGKPCSQEQEEGRVVMELKKEI